MLIWIKLRRKIRPVVDYKAIMPNFKSKKRVWEQIETKSSCT